MGFIWKKKYHESSRYDIVAWKNGCSERRNFVKQMEWWCSRVKRKELRYSAKTYRFLFIVNHNKCHTVLSLNFLNQGLGQILVHKGTSKKEVLLKCIIVKFQYQSVLWYTWYLMHSTWPWFGEAHWLKTFFPQSPCTLITPLSFQRKQLKAWNRRYWRFLVHVYRHWTP